MSIGEKHAGVMTVFIAIIQLVFLVNLNSNEVDNIQKKPFASYHVQCVQVTLTNLTIGGRPSSSILITHKVSKIYLIKDTSFG